MSQPSVVAPFDSMKNFDSGCFFFATGFGNALIRQNSEKYKLACPLFKETIGQFGKKCSCFAAFGLA